MDMGIKKLRDPGSSSLRIKHHVSEWHLQRRTSRWPEASKHRLHLVLGLLGALKL